MHRVDYLPPANRCLIRLVPHPLTGDQTTRPNNAKYVKRSILLHSEDIIVEDVVYAFAGNRTSDILLYECDVVTVHIFLKQPKENALRNRIVGQFWNGE